MPIFQSSVVSKYLSTQNKDVIHEAYNNYVHYFHDKEIQENIRLAKEEQFQEGFLRELFVKILGYTLNPQVNYNLTTEFKNEADSKKADGAILSEGKALAVIELKGTNTTNLDKVNAQAFNYKNNQTGCIYVVTSNFEKLRFFIHDAVEHIEFNLFTLSENDFYLLWLCLQVDNLLHGLPEKIKKESVIVEENITKKLYKNYADYKNDLWGNIVKNSQEPDHILLYKKTQKLLDRFLFILFSEDSGLLPPNSISRIVKRWQVLKEEDAYKPLYEIFKQFFEYINTGKTGKSSQDNIFAYNGGLFLPDEVLDSISIDDEIIHHHIVKLTAYDFQSEIDVNILGHIFENSLNDIENVKARLEGKEVDKKNSKRKRDGVFYTPKHVTKYIVGNTVGRLCEKKKEELLIDEDEFAGGVKQRKKKTIEKLHNRLKDYRTWLLNITICDPACGSGAFLNQALEFLVAEHEYIDELESKLFGSGFVFRYVSDYILENNLFGVDVNEESVEIAKLSLWLRTAQNGRKLTTLSNNIKCGNSLIDLPSIARDKAFNWEQEFPEIFLKGGFDVVIGNPPYGASFSEIEIDYFNNTYMYQSYQLDSYLLFTEKTYGLVKQDGYIGYIMPNTWLSTLFNEKIRRFVFGTFSVLEINHYSYFVFDDATVETDAYIFQATKAKDVIVNINIVSKDSSISSCIEQSEWVMKDGKPINIYETSEFKELKRKIEKHLRLGDLVSIVQGVKPFQKGKGNPRQNDDTMRLKPFVQDTQIDETFKPLLRGSLMNRYQIYWDQDYWISYGDWLAEPRYSAKFDCKEKIVIRQTGDSLIACYDEDRFICRDNLYVIRDDTGAQSLKAILAIINSRLLTWYFRKILNPEEGKAMAQVKRGHLQELPIAVQENDDDLVGLVESVMNQYKRLNRTDEKFVQYINHQIEGVGVSSKIKNWKNINFNDFIKEFGKLLKKSSGKNISKTEGIEWMELFENKKLEIKLIMDEVDSTNTKIDNMVYKLYGLTETDIKIIERT